MFGIKYISSEYDAGEGRIDTLGIDENGSPAIIEYKRGKSPNIATQALFYHIWLIDHKAKIKEDVATVDSNIEVDLNAEVRIILIAQKFDKYTRKAIQQMKPRIELKKYIRYENDMIFIEDITPGKTEGTPLPRRESRRSLKALYQKTSEKTKPIFDKLREDVGNMGEDVEEAVLMQYLAFRTSKNFVEIIPQKTQIKLYLDIPWDIIDDPKSKCRDMSGTGHWGTGNTEHVIGKDEEIEYALKMIRQSYEYTQ